MFKWLGLVVLPALICSPSSTETTQEKVNNEPIQEYVIVSEIEIERTKNTVPYTKNRDNNYQNDGIRTLEEPISKDGKIEIGPFANDGSVKKVSGEENPSIQSAMDEIDRQFEYMYELKATLDEREKETAKLWNRYYAIKEVYDRAMSKSVDKWAKDNGIEISKKHHHGLWR